MKHLFICASPRTGSNYLLNLLEQGGLESYNELLFNPGPNCANCHIFKDQLGDKLPLFVASHHFQEPVQQFDYDFYIQMIRGLYQTYSNDKPITVKWFSYSLHYLVNLLAEKGHPPKLETLQEIFGDIQWIFLKRDNKLQQAVSKFLAHERNQWVSLNFPHITPPQQEIENPPYDFDKIFRHFQACVVLERKWKEIFETLSLSPQYSVSYEQFQHYPERVVQEISDTFLLDLKPISPELSKYNKQFSSLNQKYIEQFEEDLIQRFHSSHPENSSEEVG
jgi:LPS sulfotransferase NodH